jgi:hypothetical protein
MGRRGEIEIKVGSDYLKMKENEKTHISWKPGTMIYPRFRNRKKSLFLCAKS